MARQADGHDGEAGDDCRGEDVAWVVHADPDAGDPDDKRRSGQYHAPPAAQEGVNAEASANAAVAWSLGSETPAP